MRENSENDGIAFAPSAIRQLVAPQDFGQDVWTVEWNKEEIGAIKLVDLRIPGPCGRRPLFEARSMKLMWLVVSLLLLPVCTGSAVAQSGRLALEGRSVAPGGRYVFTWKQIGLKYGEFPVYKCFLKKDGRSLGSVLGQVLADGEPEPTWSPHLRYLIVEFPHQVEEETYVYSLQRNRTVCHTWDLLTGMSADERYTFILEDRGDDDNSPAWLRVMDLQTGKAVKVAQVNFGMYGDPFQCVWFGNTSKLAFIDVKGDAWTAEVVNGPSEPSVSKRRLVGNGHCDDLRYIPGKGVYFIQKTGRSLTPYYSSDLRSVRKGALLPAKQPRDR